MTTTSAGEIVGVTEGDRRAMIAYESLSAIPLSPGFIAEILEGRHDGIGRIQLIARHRLAALEDAARACEQQARDFLSPQYATGQPASSISERFACSECATAIRALKSPPPASSEEPSV
ncbi:hypothetical protein [Novosphingobium sp. Leaf2]|uniref:hypothetical protein n=1 Tax=Novosphingobium sp. Leaf2 TaxID=1735670 RepID=UPI0006FA1DBC|nr:hypothetical protein [Novosphingobium sp. Leaf2]KQM18415.1 hypothetical protein ASE49_09395 [Novosphingobium sp. Leaf2]